VITDFFTLASLVIYFFLIYCSVYFFYIFFKRNEEPVPTLFHPGISVIIPIYNEEENIHNAITSILGQEYAGPIEIIAIDDGSTDNSRKILREYERKGLIKFVRKNKPGHPTGKISSLNLGIKLAKYDYVCVLDCDSMLEPSVFKELIGYFENPKVGAAVPVQKVYKPKTLLEKLQNIEYTLSMCIRKLLSNVGGLFMTHGVGTIFRKKALIEVGGFIEKTQTEDLNIAFKLIQRGYAIRSSFNAIGYTVVPKDLKSLYWQRIRWNSGLIENFIWYKHMIFNKEYGNLGMFVLPINIIGSFVLVYTLGLMIYEFLKNVYYNIKDLLLTNFDIAYFINENLKDLFRIRINSITVLSAISLILFIAFIYYMSKRLKTSAKGLIKSYLYLPFYFTIFFVLSAFFYIVSPYYAKKRWNKGWLKDH